MNNPIYRFKIGDFNALAISDSDEGGINLLLVDTGAQKVLLDTGVGRDVGATPAKLIDHLKLAGLSPEEINVVILTHADFDHIGGAVDEHGKLAFPNARYILSQAEWDFWGTKPLRLRQDIDYSEAFRKMEEETPKRRLAQLANYQPHPPTPSPNPERGRKSSDSYTENRLTNNVLELVESGAEIVPGIQVIGAPGHTPGNSIVSVTSGGETLLFIADLFYEPKNLEDPNWVSEYDLDGPQVIATRRRIFDQAARDNTLLMAYHLPFPGLGYVAQNGRGWVWRAREI
jgi:glyoxylase-like metal-dependent hydrolase (beta-lactamase superfamily II)